VHGKKVTVFERKNGDEWEFVMMFTRGWEKEPPGVNERRLWGTLSDNAWRGRTFAIKYGNKN